MNCCRFKPFEVLKLKIYDVYSFVFLCLHSLDPKELELVQRTSLPVKRQKQPHWTLCLA